MRYVSSVFENDGAELSSLYASSGAQAHIRELSLGIIDHFKVRYIRVPRPFPKVKKVTSVCSPPGSEAIP